MKRVVFTKGTVYTGNDFNDMQDYMDEDIRFRFDNSTNYGIVSDTNPRTDPSTGSLALQIVANRVQVQPGKAFLPNNNWVDLTTPILQDAPDDSTIYLIVLTTQNNPDVDEDFRLSEVYRETVQVRRTTVPAVSYISESGFAKLSPDEKNNLIILGMVIRDLTTQLISLRYSSERAEIQSIIRPWFTVVDQEHRLQQGTGTPTSSNPHAQSLTDFDFIGNVSLWQTFKGNTVVTANRAEHKHIVGDLFEEVVPIGDIAKNQDTFTYAEIVLPHSFLDVYSVVDSNGVRYPFRANFKHRTVEIYINQAPITADSVSLYYTRIHAGELILDAATPTQFTMSASVGEEFAVTEDEPARLSSAVLDLKPLDYFSNHYVAYLNSSGIPRLKPAMFLSPVKIVDLQNAANSEINVTFDKPSRLEFSLGKTFITPQMNVQFDIEGVLADGTTVTTERIYFVADPSLHENLPVGLTPYTPGPNIGTSSAPRYSMVDTAHFTGRVEDQWVKSVNTYSRVNAIRLTNATNVDLDAIIAGLREFDLQNELVLGEFDTRIKYEALNFVDLRRLEVLPLLPTFQPPVNAYLSESMNAPRYCSPIETEWYTQAGWMERGTYMSRTFLLDGDMTMRLYFDGLDLDTPPVLTFYVGNNEHTVTLTNSLTIHPFDYQTNRGHIIVPLSFSTWFSPSGSFAARWKLDTYGYTKVLGYTLES